MSSSTDDDGGRFTLPVPDGMYYRRLVGRVTHPK